MIWHFKKNINSAAKVIVQTDVMAKRLQEKYKIKSEKISKIAQPLPKVVADHSRGEKGNSCIALCPKPIKLLFLAAYYPHKNHSILPRVAEELYQRNLDSIVQIFITVESDNKYIKRITSKLGPFSKVITNLGRLSSFEAFESIKESSALFLPTLLESYGLIYIEAMHYGLPILTSDRDFSRWMCRDLAYYFNPLSSRSIVDTIERFMKNKDVLYEAHAIKRIAEFPENWNDVAKLFISTLV